MSLSKISLFSTDSDSSEWETISTGTSRAPSDFSGFTASIGSETATSLLDDYVHFFRDMNMVLNLPSQADATQGSENENRVITDFEFDVAYEQHQKFTTLYLQVAETAKVYWYGFCNEPRVMTRNKTFFVAPRKVDIK